MKAQSSTSWSGRSHRIICGRCCCRRWRRRWEREASPVVNASEARHTNRCHFPRRRGIQYAAAHRFNHYCLGLLDRPVKPGDDSCMCGCTSARASRVRDTRTTSAHPPHPPRSPQATPVQHHSAWSAASGRWRTPSSAA
ncbi:hypothetical protein F8237_16230 [Bradyrhizobium betae]|uniref:Uncharacterized protein n=1 Tax=Bradyrhizobium betae TaxID=244734 RepID=A0A5P6P683_9BRAD|nr:hypothetical protein F8237_16230 [Bradyrhizobium betae]